MRTVALVLLVLVSASAAVAQEPPPGGWPSPLPITGGPPPAPPVGDGLPVRAVETVPFPEAAPGQQHWVTLNLSVLQPFVGRIGVKVWPRANNSVWLEAYGGSVLFDAMYGFGARVQHTAWTPGNNDVVMLSPGLGMHIIPSGGALWRHQSTLVYLAADVQLSWLHDFSPHFGYEVGMTVGLAGRVAGNWGDSNRPRGVMFGPDLYPLLNIYSGFRF